ncbi:MAG: YlxM family DNA-binding protein [Anaerovoracaceae bacterium]
MIDEIAKSSLLYDFYGELLTKRQKDVIELYHDENLSLSEIAEEFGISRQGVHDSLKNAEKSLLSYEKKLGLVAKFEKNRNVIKLVDKELNKLILENQINSMVKDKLTYIKGIIDNMGEQ